jgi:hypothetical protein
MPSTSALDEPPPTPPYACPWCPYTDVRLKKMMNHLESAHHDRWCALAFDPLIAGRGPV